MTYIRYLRKESVLDDRPICIIEVNENLRRIKLGEELTRPLKQLNENCEFKKRYEEFCNIQDGLDPDTDIKKFEHIIKLKEYYIKNKDKYKGYSKKYYNKIRKNKLIQ